LAEEFYKNSANKIEALIRIAAAANSMEFGVKGHDFDNSTFSGVFRETLDEKLYGDPEEIRRRLDSFGNIFYLTDNNGEVIFDLFVIARLKEMGKRVVVGSKSEPVLNDVTISEMKAMSEVDVIPTGDVVGTALEFLTDEARSLLFDPCWLILSKGMGNYETISEYEEKLSGRLIYIMRAKCEPVAAALGVPKGTLVARPI
ncbi:MAG: ARMT1-like domain-containing protein, partial [Methanothrix sp.]|nr:ARMT1-like domain-containing protein [Methanothrix sp.]